MLNSIYNIILKIKMLYKDIEDNGNFSVSFFYRRFSQLIMAKVMIKIRRLKRVN